MLKDERVIVTPAWGSAMAKLREVDLKTNPEIAEAFKRLEASRGWISNLMRSIAHAPEGLQRYQALGHYARYDTELTEAQKELVVCATVRNVSYGWEHHAPLAKQCGVTDGQLALLKEGEIPPDLPPGDQALCRFTFEFSSFKGVRQETATELLRHFTERQIVDMALISAFYLSAGALIIGFDVELEGPDALHREQDWQRQKLQGA
jgi:4-carboxymuconolactone decarboxylase